MTLRNDPYTWGTGRRKTSVARVRIKSGSGRFLVNGRDADEFFTTADTKLMVSRPLSVTETAENYDIWANVQGGGVNGQAGAVSLGLARALRRENEGYEPALREHGLLTRDARKVERKKPGLRKARKATQYSKR